MRHFVSLDVLKQLYHSFISPHLSYGIINWGGASKSATNNLRKSLKKAIKIMNFAGYRPESKPLFSKLGLLTFEDTYEFETAKFMYDVNNNNITSTLCDLFKKTNVQHSYKTRQVTQNQFSLPLVTTECFKKFITFNCIKIWNKIPLEIRSLSSKNKFSKVLYKWLLQHF